MPKRDIAPTGAPCWIELGTTDTDASRAFYGELFGWTAEDPAEEFGGYINFTKDGVRVAGCMGNADLPSGWLVYLASSEAKVTADDTAAHGGAVIVPPMQVGELGTMAVVTDAGQATVGIWQPGLHPGFGLMAEPGTPSWFELHTRAYDASVQFYRDVFGWDTHVASDTPDFRYTTLGTGDTQLAGIMDASAFLPDGVPSQWAVYFGADDTDAALAKIVELGGSVVLPAEDTPYGRLATAADPTGAQFKLVAGG